jgi:hypothetical protein
MRQHRQVVCQLLDVSPDFDSKKYGTSFLLKALLLLEHRWRHGIRTTLVIRDDQRMVWSERLKVAQRERALRGLGPIRAWLPPSQWGGGWLVVQ